MLNSPFIGFSTIIHLFIIFMRKVLYGKRKTMNTKIPRKTTFFNSITNTCIIAIVFVSVIIQAGILVRSSIRDKHSSVKMFNNLVIQIKKSNLASPPQNQSQIYVLLN